MALRVTMEDRKVIKDEFAVDHSKQIDFAIKQLKIYKKDKNDKKINKILKNDKLEKIAVDLLFTLAMLEDKPLPIQSVAGMIVNKLAISDKYKDRKMAMKVAMEILVFTIFTEFTISKNNKPMITSLISNEDYRIKNIYLPLERPTEDHLELGSFNWNLSEVEALDKLNKYKWQIIPLNEGQIEHPEPNDFSPEAMKIREQYNKQQVRKLISNDMENKTIYFNWASDYRGRMYSVGYYIQPQGNEIEKNMIHLAKGEKLSLYGIIQIKKSIASAYGLDKKTDDKKLEWFVNNESRLNTLIKDAKEPYTMQCLVKEYNKYLNNKEVTGLIELDASNSQSQILSLLLKSKKNAKTCNVINTEEDGKIVIKDLYQEVADAMTDILTEMLGGNNNGNSVNNDEEPKWKMEGDICSK